MGKVTISKDTANYRVSSLKDINNVIIPHFLKYPLITQKKADFILFKNVVEIMNLKEHLSIEGLKKIVSIKASLNRGLSKDLKLHFSNVVPIERPVISEPQIIDPN